MPYYTNPFIYPQLSCTLNISWHDKGVDEKSIKPSQRKLKKAREKGEFAYSTDLTFSCIVLSGLILLWFFSASLKGRLERIFGVISTHLEPLDALKYTMEEISFPLGMILGGILLAALCFQWLQRGWIWAWRKGKKKSPYNPVMPILRVVVVASVGYCVMKKSHFSIKPEAILETLFSLLLKVVCALIVLGFGDLIYQKWQFYRRMHMTQQEAKDEHRETEGNKSTRQ